MNSETTKKLQIGWFEISITPDMPAGLAGQFIERISQYVETPVTATAMAISSEDEEVVICSCDLVGVSGELVAAIRERVGRYGGINPGNVIINATHTHTSLEYRDGLDTLAFSAKILERYLPYKQMKKTSDREIMGEEEAFDFLADRIAECIIRAWNTRVPSDVFFAFGRAAVGMCRRVVYSDGSALMWGDTNREDFQALEGGCDSGMELMYICDTGGRLCGIAVNIACPAQVLEHRLFISSDYWGKVKRRIRERFGSDIHVLALCAPAGDQCPRDLIRWVDPEEPVADPNINHGSHAVKRADPSMFDLSGAETVARRIASEIIGVYEEGKMDRADCVFRRSVKMMKLPVRRVTEQERDIAARKITEAVGDISDTKKASFNYNDNAKLYVYAGTIARYETQDNQPYVEMELHTMRIGDVAFAFNPFELFLDYANRIRALSPAAQTFLVQLAGDSLGYLPTEKAESGGHYSAYVSSGITGHEGGAMLVRETRKEINALFAEDFPIV